jgi:hypothetical protein
LGTPTDPRRILARVLDRRVSLVVVRRTEVRPASATVEDAGKDACHAGTDEAVRFGGAVVIDGRSAAALRRLNKQLPADPRLNGAASGERDHSKENEDLTHSPSMKR